MKLTIDQVLQQAVDAHKEGRLDEAEINYRKAIELNPKNASTHYNLGVNLQIRGRSNEAEASYKKAIEIKPNFTEAYNNLANLIKNFGRLDEAEINYKKAIEIKPNFAEAYCNLGIMQKELGKFEEAEINYKKAIEIKPNFADAYNNLGTIQKDLGRLDEAEINYKKAIEIKPNFAEAYLNAGRIFKELGQITNAVKYFEQALKINPEDHLGVNLELASLGKKNIPNKTPQIYMQDFYRIKSKIWNNFKTNRYQGEKLIEDVFKQSHKINEKSDILDLGCGTGSLASFFRPYANILNGVDLSVDMLKAAKKTNIYDSLYNKELEEYLAEASIHYDTIVSSAVMIHFFDLKNTFSLIRDSLKKNGKFIFSVFEAKEKDRELNSFLLYSHSDNYITTLAERLKFKINYRQKGVHEYHKGNPINAIIYELEKHT